MTIIFFLSLSLFFFASLMFFFFIKKTKEIRDLLEKVAKIEVNGAGKHTESPVVFDGEEATKKRVIEYSTIWDEVSVGICVVDLYGRLISANPYFTRTTGCGSQGMVPKDMWTFFYPDHVERARFVKEILRQGEIKGQEIRMGGGCGRDLWFSFTGRKIKFGDAEGDYIVCILEDISERKKEEERRNLKEKMDTIYRITGGLAHTMNNKLMGIQGVISLMGSEKEKSHQDYSKLKAVEKQVQEASGLIRELLSFMKWDGEKRERLDIGNLIKKTAEEFKKKRPSIRIKTWFEEGLYLIEANREQMERMLIHLYMNAQEAMPGGGLLKVEAENISIDDKKSYGSSPMRSGKYLLISVSDSGMGMDDTTKRSIFEPFFTTKDAHIGLGLTYVYGIVRAHKGYIDVESRLYSGTTFRIYIPATEGEGNLQKLPKVLIIDDEEVVLNIATEMVGTLGYHTKTAKTVGEAIELLKGDPGGFDIVILDLEMDRTNGYAISHMFKRANPDGKILFSTEYDTKVLQGEKTCKGNRFFIRKPLTMDELTMKLKGLVGG